MHYIIKLIFIVSSTISLSIYAAEIKEVSFNINGMTCEGCVGKVSVILDETVGVSKYNVSLKNKNCKISYDAAQTNPDAIKVALSKTQYTINDVTNEKQKTSLLYWLKNIFN